VSKRKKRGKREQKGVGQNPKIIFLAREYQWGGEIRDARGRKKAVGNHPTA